MPTIRQLLAGTPKYATGERREVPREWIRCSHCRRLLKKGHQAMYYTPNQVYRCDDCERTGAPAVQVYEDSEPGECPNCFQRARELSVTITVNGTDLDVCVTCGSFTDLPTKPAPKRDTVLMF